MSTTATTESTKTAEGHVRPFEPGDVRAVAGLLMRVFEGRDDTPDQNLCDRMQRFFFTDPWRSLDVSPQVVYVDAQDRIWGFWGPYPRRLVHKGEPVTGVSVGQFMVDPSQQRKGIGKKMVNAVLGGPQAITFSNSANAASVAVLGKLDFWNPAFMGMRWYKRLDVPTDETGGLVTRMKRMLRPAATTTPGITCRPIRDAAEWHALRSTMIETYDVCSDFDLSHAAWMWDILHDSPMRGQFGTCVATDSRNNAIGWALWFRTPEGVARVLEWGGAPDRLRDVASPMLTYMHENSIREATGFCTSPAMAAATVAQGCEIIADPSAWVIHCQDANVRRAIVDGRIWWSELDGDDFVTFRT